MKIILFILLTLSMTFVAMLIKRLRLNVIPAQNNLILRMLRFHICQQRAEENGESML